MYSNSSAQRSDLTLSSIVSPNGWSETKVTDVDNRAANLKYRLGHV